VLCPGASCSFTRHQPSGLTRERGKRSARPTLSSPACKGKIGDQYMHIKFTHLTENPYLDPDPREGSFADPDPDPIDSIMFLKTELKKIYETEKKQDH
jgi:hypothetical protein